MKTKRCAIPPTSVILHEKFDYADSFEGNVIDLHQNIDTYKIVKAFFSSSPKWIENLFSFRNALVKRLGLKIPEKITDRKKQLDEFKGQVGERMGLFRVFYRDENEVIIGEDDKHLNFRVSLYLQSAENTKQEKTLTISTVVKFHSWLGRLYFLPVKPFHSLIVPTMLKGIIKHLEDLQS